LPPVNTVATKEIRRADDGELLGLLIECGELWIPATVFGGRLAAPTSRQEAEEIVRAEGLASLADSWWLRQDGQPWQEIWFLEIRSDRVRVNDRNPNYGTSAARWVGVDEVDLQRWRPAVLS
jgi:hypothetical protein